MTPSRPRWNWTGLLLLGLSSYMTVWAFGFAFPFNEAASSVPPGSPAPYTPATYPWAAGLACSAVTAIIFLWCLRDPHQRRAAFAAFGLAALLTGPGYAANAARLAQFSPTSSPWAAPHLPLALTALCWIASAALFGWWLLRSIPLAQQGPVPMQLFGGLLVVLLLMPWMTNRCGIESLRLFAQLPANANAVRGTPDGVTHLLVNGMTGSIGDVCCFLAQWIGLAASLLTLLALAPGLVSNLLPGRFKTGFSANPFPSRNDLVPVLLLALGGLLFWITAAGMENLTNNMSSVVATLHRPLYGYAAGTFTVEILAGLVFLAGSWMVWRRMRTAPQVRLGFSLLVLLASLALAALTLFNAPGAMKAVGVLALILGFVQGIALFDPKRRAAWTSSAFVSPGATALSFALQGSVMLAVLASAFTAIALEIAMVSVMAIRYLIDWGNALKLPHGVAPVEKIAPGFAPTLTALTVALGPVYFAACLLAVAAAVLVFSLVYAGTQGCGKLYRAARPSQRRAPETSPGTSLLRTLGLSTK